ncbi:MAG TPA: restriction endonuclease [Actinomycetota bacterium]|nr:restriction endonuclease [Actinomycetota bacterium]
MTCPFCSNRLPDYLRQQAVQAREEERRRKEAERAQKAAERAAAQHEVQAATAEVERMNQLLDARVTRLESLLAETLAVDDHLDFETLKDDVDLPEFDAGRLGVPAPRPNLDKPTLDSPPEPSFFGKLRPGWKKRHSDAVAAASTSYQLAVAAAETAHHESLRRFDAQERTRTEKLEVAKREHEAAATQLKQEVEAQHKRIDQFRTEFEARKPEAVCAYFNLVLERSSYPDDFPKTARLAFVPDSRQLVVEYDLPTFEAVPDVASYKYVKSKNSVTETKRPQAQRKQLYASVVAQVTIRTLHELFEADRSQLLETIVFNGMVNAIDKGTGKEVRPCLVTVRTTRTAFEAIDLSRVEPVACLRALNASVSKSPAELAPVRPVLEFNMVDPRFVDSPDVISELDQRPNLMDLSPTEFEGLIANLFEKMGLEMRQTRPSRDGGVDCVAYDPRPIFGGKVVIQAKRYKNTVGVAAVRDLYGTVHNEGASKGILVTTSGYGQSSFEFAQGKPMELLDGANLLFLLAEHAGFEAKIEPPEDWVDPVLQG